MCRRIKIWRLNSCHTHRCTGGMKPLCTELFHIPHLVCFITNSQGSRICLKTNQEGLDWLLALEICSPPASHGSCSFSMEMAVSGEGTHSVLSTGVKLQWEPWGCSQQPHPKGRSLSRLWGAWQSLIPWGKVPAQLGTSPGLCRWVPASQQCPTSTPLPKTQALSTAELIWSNIYSVIKKLFISLSDDKIMVE